MQIVFRLLPEGRQLNVDAGAFTVRPPAAPTADGEYEARAQVLGTAFVQSGRKPGGFFATGKSWATNE